VARREAIRYKFDIEVRGREVIVRRPEQHFTATYYKAASQPQLILRERSKCDDFALLAAAWQAANTRARELGWIV
jgi:hypothetical protein